MDKKLTQGLTYVDLFSYYMYIFNLYLCCAKTTVISTKMSKYSVS